MSGSQPPATGDAEQVSMELVEMLLKKMERTAPTALIIQLISTPHRPDSMSATTCNEVISAILALEESEPGTFAQLALLFGKILFSQSQVEAEGEIIARTLSSARHTTITHMMEELEATHLELENMMPPYGKVLVWIAQWLA